MNPIKRQVIIFPEDTEEVEMARIKEAFRTDGDIFIRGKFEIWEKDLETGRLVQLR